jgi:uncharacterized protein
MKNRLLSIDQLRGVSLLGILFMNIGAFALPSIAYYNPYSFFLTDLDIAVFASIHLFAAQKFMALFSMLFGVSMLLFFRKYEPATFKRKCTFFIRNFWLLMIGLLHFCFLWFGDVLMVYALCSFFLFFCRKFSPRLLCTIGLVIYFLPTFNAVYMHYYIADELAQNDQVAVRNYWLGQNAGPLNEINAYTADYATQVDFRANRSSEIIESDNQELVDRMGFSLLLDFFARAFGMMFIGMALYRWHFFDVSNQKYWATLFKLCFTIGLTVGCVGLYLLYKCEWSWDYAIYLGRIPNNIATPFMAIAYASLVMMWSQSSFCTKLQQQLQQLGKMALTGYLLQSVLCGFIFYGYGFCFYGTLNRAWQMLIVVLIGAFLLNFASFWMKKFKYGPIEYIWRVLTHFKFRFN